MNNRSPLVVARVSGGLGNQLFQYAAGLSLAERIGGELKLDLSWYKSEIRDDRRFCLAHFLATASVASESDVARVKRFRLEQDMTVFDQRIFSVADDVYLCGFWVSARYFQGAEESVRRAFGFSSPLVEEYARLYVNRVRSQGKGGPVIGMHVRRGDNTRTANFNRFQIHPNAFYDEASGHFPPGSVFVIFSDTPLDLEWCQVNMSRRADCNYIYCDGHGWLFDFAIMTACDHLIISMSTFSWWAAWLNQTAGRIVVSPHPIQGTGPHYAHIRQDDYLQPEWRVITLPPDA
jgi:hypothetical protein